MTIVLKLSSSFQILLGCVVCVSIMVIFIKFDLV